MNRYRAILFTCCVLVFVCHSSVVAASSDEQQDSDFDGLPDSRELVLGTDPWLADTDGDGLSDLLEVGTDVPEPLDSDQDRRINALDIDDDNDGIPTVLESKQDSDGDGVADYLDPDADNDGRPDHDEAGLSGLDSDNDGLDDVFDADFYQTGDPNGDGVYGYRLLPDSDGDGLPDVLDVIDEGNIGDLDGDGIPDELEKGFDEADPVDTDGDGIFDYLDPDDDGDGVPTLLEGEKDRDNDGRVNYLDVDHSLYFYCINDGRIISGISDFKVSPAEGVALWSDEGSGYYFWQAAQPGAYTLEFTVPEGMSTAGRLDKGTYHDAEADNTPENIVVALGRGEDIARPGYLADFNPADLPGWYRHFQLQSTGKILLNMNIPLTGSGCDAE
ncbi:MAG: hypothetical protein R3F02_09835 [Thiolinea sp.]